MLLDTHVMLWLRLGRRELGTGARVEIDRAWQSGQVAVSAISFWEVAMLKSKGRIRFPEDVALWRKEQLAQGVVEIAVDGEIGIDAVSLIDFHADPTDRFIVATALRGHLLATADQQILDWTGNVSRLDARR